jgi:hypothetical protein
MRRKILVYSFRIFAGVLLILSILLLLALRLSNKGDIVDRNDNWIGLAFLVALAIYFYSRNISDGSPKIIYKKKTMDQLMNEVKRPTNKI